jgi:hypothetical protein
MNINKIEYSLLKKTRAEFIIEEVKKFNGEDVGEIFATLASKINDEETLDETQKKVLVGLCMDYRQQIAVIDKDDKIDYETKKLKRQEHLNTFSDYFKNFFE